MQGARSPLSLRKLPIATTVTSLITVLSIMATVQAVVPFTPDYTFTALPIDCTNNFANNNTHYNKINANSSCKFKDIEISALASSNSQSTSLASTSPNSTATSEPEKSLLLDEVYTVLLIVCFTAVLVAVSLMIAAVELNNWRYRKITL